MGKTSARKPENFWHGKDGHNHKFKTNFSNYNRVCTVCGWIFKDMDTYLCEVCENLLVTSVIDVGTDLKGVVGSHFWRNKMHIQEGWAVDIWKIKDMVFWKPLNMDALKLETVFKPNSVDVVQAFGFLEHLEKEEGYRFLEIAERIAKQVVIVSAASELHGSTRDYKVVKDGNPYHYYNSLWSWKDFEELGYTSNIEDMKDELTFQNESFGWKVLNNAVHITSKEKLPTN